MHFPVVPTARRRDGKEKSGARESLSTCEFACARVNSGKRGEALSGDVHLGLICDQARTHGVGYYSFSTDEAERQRQQEQLRNLRKETLENQAAAQEAADRKKKQMQERLRAARRRKRERLGLPPEDDTEEPEEEEQKPEKPEELKREEQPTSTIRPWDIGKDKVTRILTQEEWIEKKREERPEEFAPPENLEPPQRKKRRKPPSPYREEVQKPVVEERRGAEIPPPPSLETGTRRYQQTLGPADMEKSVEEGLSFIRRQIEEKQLQKTKSPFDIV
ncbi:UNVERIFIED_CONTAM: hypothetical protein PYX00_003975 [Menopon gallinae]|uniref:Uncharacterized protein n=1 Tax=Menopon gallinae TaxID=328185 RepID=A0AAW2I1Z9_9NEOP